MQIAQLYNKFIVNIAQQMLYILSELGLFLDVSHTHIILIEWE